MTTPQAHSVINLAGRGTVPAAICKRCGEPDLAWVKSSKSAKFYLCQTTPAANESDARRAVPWAPHNCDAYRARMTQVLPETEAPAEMRARLRAEILAEIAESGQI